MNSNLEQNELAGNSKRSYTLIIAYAFMGVITIVMTGFLCYYLFRIFE